MTRPLYWERTFNTSFNWSSSTSGNQFIASISAGETLTRAILDLRFWAAAVDQVPPITEHRLYVPYTFCLFWADPDVIPNPTLINVQTLVQSYADHVLHFERFAMRDAYTPPKFTGVNIGWIDDRPSQTVNVRAQRRNARPSGQVVDLRIAWQANASILADPLEFTPLCSSSVLIRGLAALPWWGTERSSTMALYLLRASGTWNGSETFNFGMHATSAAAVAAVADDWAAALTEAWSGAGTPAGTLNTYYGAEVVLGTATAAALSATTGQQQARADVDINLPGVSASDNLPPQCAIVVSLRTDVANRSGRGRFFLPAPAFNACVAGLIGPAVQQDFVDAITRLFAGLDSSAITPVLFSRSTFLQTTITSFNIGNVFDTQRRRRNGLQEVRIAGNV